MVERLSGTELTEDNPFRRPGLLAKIFPFGAIAVIAEASVILPPGPALPRAAVVSLILLVAAGAATVLPWSRLPSWMPVLVPLTYTGSVLALMLAAGANSGEGIVILIPLLWTALFQRPWQSACVIAAIAIVEAVISLVPVVADGSEIARRVVLWASLGTVIAVATHGLRDRLRRSQAEADQLNRRLREAEVIEDRDRIAAALQDHVIQRIFATGITLQGAAALTAEPNARSRIEESVDELDHAMRVLRDAIFGLDRRAQGRGLRQALLALCGELSVAPDLSFSGPVDGALLPGMQAQLLDVLGDAMALVSQYAVPSHLNIDASKTAYVAVLETGPGIGLKEAQESLERTRAAVREAAERAGMGVDIESTPSGIRFTWHVPLLAVQA